MAKRKFTVSEKKPEENKLTPQAQAVESLGGFDKDAYTAKALNRFGSYGSYNTAGYDPSTKKLPSPQPDWDYRSASTGMNGEVLPFGAESWDAFGRPYYGEGLAGYWNGVVSRVSSPTKAMPQYAPDPGDEKALEWFGRIVGNIGESFKLSDTFGIDSPLTYGLRVSKEVVGGALNALQLPAIAIERTIGVLTPAISSQARTTDEALQAARIAYSSFGNTALVSTFLTRYRNGENPELLAMELQNPGRELIGQLILDPLNLIGFVGRAGRAAAKASDIAQTGKGWKLEGAITKMFGMGNKIDDVSDAGKAASNLVEADRLIAAKQAAIKASRMKQEYGLAATVAAGRQSHFANRVMDGINGIISDVSKFGGDHMTAVDYFHEMSRAASDIPEVATAGRLALSQTPIGQKLLSDNGLELGVYLNKTIGEGRQAAKFAANVEKLKGDLPELIKFFSNTADRVSRELFPTIDDMVLATEKVAKATASGKTVGASVQNAADMLKDVSRSALNYNKVDNKLNKVFRPLNSFFGKVYMGASPGYAARNMMNNTFTLLVDQGPSAFVVDAAGKKKLINTYEVVQASTKNMLGFNIAAESRGIGKQVEIAGGAIGKSGLLDIIPNWATKNEQYTAALYVNNSVRKTLKATLPKALLPFKESLQNAGADPQTVNLIMQAAVDEFGDIPAAMEKIRGISTGNTVSAGRDITMLPYNTRKYFEDAGLYDDLRRIFNDPELSKLEEVVGNIDDLRKSHVKIGENVTGDAIGAARDADYSPSVAELSEWTSSGFIPESEGNTFTAMVQSNGNTRQSYFNVKDKALLASKETGADPTDFFAPLKTDGGKLSGDLSKLNNTIWDLHENGGSLVEWNRAADVLGVRIPEGTRPQEVIFPALQEYKSKMWKEHFLEIYDNTDAGLQKILPTIDDTKGEFAEHIKLLAEKRAYSEQMMDAAYDDKTSKLVFDSLARERGAIEAGGLGANTSIANAFGVSSATEAGGRNEKHILNIVNKYADEATDITDDVRKTLKAEEEALNTKLWDSTTPKEDIQGIKDRMRVIGDTINPAEGDRYNKLEDVPSDVVLDAFVKRGKIGEDAADAKDIENIVKSIGGAVEDMIPPQVPDAMPSKARQVHESTKGFNNAVDELIEMVTERWGESINIHTEDIEKALADAPTLVADNMAIARQAAADVATADRDFGLLDYTDKKYRDIALAKLYPYQFWYSGTYKNWLSRVGSNPEVLAHYGKYRNHLEKIHAGMPEWWKYNINSNELLGREDDNPLYFNLESSIWPLNGITGIDFNDPYKRVNGFTALLDDLGKFGPTTWTPYSIATAVALAAKGEDEAAARWGGRLFPQTASLKSMLALGNVKQNVELDPMVRAFSGKDMFSGNVYDVYERRRIGRALSAMVDRGEITEEQALDAANLQEGDLWDEAAFQSARKRAPGQLSSFLAGTGFKGRNEQDIRTDQFYADYFSLMGQYDNLRPEEVREGFNTLRTQYPFMDSLLLSRKDGVDRDRAYGYAVIGRIPPGQSSDLAKMVGMPEDMLSKFYEDKGRIDTWAKTDQERFKAGIMDLAAVLEAPSDATSAEWTEVRNQYGFVRDDAKQIFGEDIQDMTNIYYNFPLETQTQRDERKEWLDSNPAVSSYLDWYAKRVTLDPFLNAYYGGINSIESYIRRQMNEDLDIRVGKEIFNTLDEYYFLRATNSKEARKFKKEHPEIAEYYDIKDEWVRRENEEIVRVSKILRDPPDIPFRPDIPESFGTQGVLEGLAQEQAVNWQVVLPPEVMRVVQSYWTDGEDIPYYVEQYLDNIAYENGAEGANEILRDVGASFR